MPPIRLFASPRKRTTMKEKRSNEVIISMPMPVNQIFSIMERGNVMKFFRSLTLQTFFTFSGLGFFIFSRFINSRHYHRLLFRNQMLLLRLCVYIKKISMNIKFQLLFASRIFPFKWVYVISKFRIQKFHRVCYCLQYIKLGFRHAGSSFSRFPCCRSWSVLEKVVSQITSRCV